jgi:hypothetical protein
MLDDLCNFISNLYPLPWITSKTVMLVIKTKPDDLLLNIIFFLYSLSIDNPDNTFAEQKIPEQKIPEQKIPELMRKMSDNNENYKQPNIIQKSNWHKIKSLYCQTLKIGKYSSCNKNITAAKEADEAYVIDHDNRPSLNREMSSSLGGSALHLSLNSRMVSTVTDLEDLYNDFKTEEYNKIKKIMLDDIDFAGRTNLPCKYGVKQLFFGQGNILLTYNKRVGDGGVIKNKRKMRKSKRKGQRKSKRKGQRKSKRKGQRKSKRKGQRKSKRKVRRHRRRTRK